MKPMSNKVIFITGAASGIGRATALAFARNGANIAIASYLSPGGREFVASELPATLAATFATSVRRIPIEQLLVTPAVTLGHAHELVASVCVALVELLSEESVAVIRSTMPPALRALFAPPSAAYVHEAIPCSSPALATGRPGSQHPVSEAKPERSQQDSIADTNPHGAIKLSNAIGMTQERFLETLADGATATASERTSPR